jgi:tRNA pseudouridine38-40 synthase
MPRYKILIEYEGTNYSGWQIQKEDRSIQEVIEQALSTAMRVRTPIVGSGRTDAGVHARGQVAHFDSEEAIDEQRLTASLNGLLPDDIAVLTTQAVEDSFHARYDASYRRYRYHVATRATAIERRFRNRVSADTDFQLMNDAASALIAEADFSSFCRTQSETRNRRCSVTRASWTDQGSGFHCFEIQADRFLHGMVRAVVGTLLEIGRGLRSADSLPEVLEARDRRAAGPAAPPFGLVLEEVSYSGSPRGTRSANPQPEDAWE